MNNDNGSEPETTILKAEIKEFQAAVDAAIARLEKEKARIEGVIAKRGMKETPNVSDKVYQKRLISIPKTIDSLLEAREDLNACQKFHANGRIPGLLTKSQLLKSSGPLRQSISPEIASIPEGANTRIRSSSVRHVPPPINVDAASSYISGPLVNSPIQTVSPTQIAATPSSAGQSVFSEQPILTPQSTGFPSPSSSVFRRLTSFMQSAKDRILESGRKIESLGAVRPGFTARIIDRSNSRIYVEAVRSSDDLANSSQLAGRRELAPVIEITEALHPAFFGNKNTDQPFDVVRANVSQSGRLEVVNLTQQERDFEKSIKGQFNLVGPTGEFMGKVVQAAGGSIYAHRLVEMPDGIESAANLYKIDMSNASERPAPGTYIQIKSIQEIDKHTVVVTPVTKELAMERMYLEYEDLKMTQPVSEPRSSFAGTVVKTFGDKFYIRQSPKRVDGMIKAGESMPLIKVDMSSFPPGTTLSEGDYVKGNAIIDHSGETRVIVVKEANPQSMPPTPGTKPSPPLTLADWLNAAEKQARIKGEQGIATRVKIGGQMVKPQVGTVHGGKFHIRPEPTKNALQAFNKLPSNHQEELRNYVAEHCPGVERFSIQNFNPEKSFKDYAFPIDKIVANKETDDMLVLATPLRPGANQDSIAKIIPIPIDYIDQLIAAHGATLANRNSAHVSQSPHGERHDSINREGENGNTPGGQSPQNSNPSRPGRSGR